MIAWTIKLATLVLGQTETAVRLPIVLALGLTTFYLTLAAKRWFGARAAFFTALLTQSILGFNAAGLLATPDGLQIAGWAGACYHVAAAYENDRPSDWLLAGAWFGFGMLSKYTMALFPPLAFLFGLYHPDYRRRLTGLWPYAGIALGILIFMPVIAKLGFNTPPLAA
jgi:4-amino-4-deoxy-L-arabinose transferase-like glycosyltransferase